jgi:hypothetical protein
MSANILLTDLLRARHKSLQTRIVALGVDSPARRAMVVQLAEDLVAHATVEQLVLYPFAEELLGVTGLSVDIERSLDALVGVVGSIEQSSEFGPALARLSAAFERHVEGDELGLLPMIEAAGHADHLLRMGQAVEEFERALASQTRSAPDQSSDTGKLGHSGLQFRWRHWARSS